VHRYVKINKRNSRADVEKMKEIKIALAPLAGVTDASFRKICKSFGADLMTTEMVSAKGLYYGDRKSAELMKVYEEEKPVGIQIFGSEPDIIAFAAKKAEEFEPSFIDINMGCPMPKIVNNGDGSALMKDMKKAAAVIESAVKAVSLPVSVKFRSGFDATNVNAVEFARMCEDSGAAFITVHGRTREQMYSGFADRRIIAEVKKAVKIPVFANGDIFTPEDAVSMINDTDADGIAIGRGALGNPFLFAQIKQYIESGAYETISYGQRLKTAMEQVRDMCARKEERIAIPEARKHLAWYIKGMPGANKCKTEIFSARTLEETERIIRAFEQTL